MSSSERATAARLSADPMAPGRGLAGLIDVLDRADGGSPHARPRTRRARASTAAQSAPGDHPRLHARARR
ncbi:hypothetical protein, partial [Blastococcus sp. CT_GayMR16]|uniref:hypothetical protein n=1 Tax=Blastococcus sp. CT_GayMR16 TaxID=2559607 RepID=UPI001ADD7297